MQQLCYYIFATELQQAKGVILIRIKRKLIFNCFDKEDECIFCGEFKDTYSKICRDCVIKCLTPRFCSEYLAHQTKLAKKHFNYDYESELREMYFKKYGKIFDLSQKSAIKFLKNYCLNDEVTLTDYIRNGGK